MTQLILQQGIILQQPPFLVSSLKANVSGLETGTRLLLLLRRRHRYCRLQAGSLRIAPKKVISHPPLLLR